MIKNIVIFGVGNISFVYVDNRRKILVLGESPTHRLENTTITTEAKYPINVTQSGKKIMLSLRYNGSNRFLFVNAVKMYQFKAKESEIKPYPLCLENVSKGFIINNLK